MKKENVLWSMKLFKIHDKERVFFFPPFSFTLKAQDLFAE